jgi:hypothetical protein
MHTSVALPGSKSIKERCPGSPGPSRRLAPGRKGQGNHKPADLSYALSIRINLGSTYIDGAPVETPGGGWLLRYHQEGANSAVRDRMFTNRGLMQLKARDRRSTMDVGYTRVLMRWRYRFGPDP